MKRPSRTGCRVLLALTVVLLGRAGAYDLLPWVKSRLFPAHKGFCS
jgi:hypothetical protein